MVGKNKRELLEAIRRHRRAPLASPDVCKGDKEHPRQIHLTLNPVTLYQRIDETLERVWNLAR